MRATGVVAFRFSEGMIAASREAFRVWRWMFMEWLLRSWPLRLQRRHSPLTPSDGGCSNGFSGRSFPIDRWSTEQRAQPIRRQARFLGTVDSCHRAFGGALRGSTLRVRSIIGAQGRKRGGRVHFSIIFVGRSFRTFLFLFRSSLTGTFEFNSTTSCSRSPCRRDEHGAWTAVSLINI